MPHEADLEEAGEIDRCLAEVEAHRGPEPLPDETLRRLLYLLENGRWPSDGVILSRDQRGRVKSLVARDVRARGGRHAAGQVVLVSMDGEELRIELPW